MKKIVLISIALALCIPVITFAADVTLTSDGKVPGTPFQNLQGQIDQLNTKVNNIQLTPGPAGPAGPAGAQGPAGPAGPAGTSGDVIPPVIIHDAPSVYTSPNSVLTVNLAISDDKELAYFAVQNITNVTPTVMSGLSFIEPGKASVNTPVELQLVTGANRFLFIASDISGNIVKSVADIQYTPSNANCIGVVEWAVIEYPPFLACNSGTNCGPVYGLTIVPGVSGNGQTPCLQAQVGYGPKGSDFTGSNWIWTEGNFIANLPPNEDEFSASFLAPIPGEYDYVYRFRITGTNWKYGDMNGNITGTQSQNPGRLLVF